MVSHLWTFYLLFFLEINIALFKFQSDQIQNKINNSRRKQKYFVVTRFLISFQRHKIVTDSVEMLLKINRFHVFDFFFLSLKNRNLLREQILEFKFDLVLDFERNPRVKPSK